MGGWIGWMGVRYKVWLVNKKTLFTIQVEPQKHMPGRDIEGGKTIFSKVCLLEVLSLFKRGWDGSNIVGTEIKGENVLEGHERVDCLDRVAS